MPPVRPLFATSNTPLPERSFGVKSNLQLRAGPNWYNDLCRFNAECSRRFTRQRNAGRTRAQVPDNDVFRADSFDRRMRHHNLLSVLEISSFGEEMANDTSEPEETKTLS